MEWLEGWGVPVLLVGGLGGLTLLFALLIGRWIDAQSRTVVDEPRRDRKR